MGYNEESAPCLANKNIKEKENIIDWILFSVCF